MQKKKHQAKCNNCNEENVTVVIVNNQNLCKYCYNQYIDSFIEQEIRLHEKSLIKKLSPVDAYDKKREQN